MAKQVDQQFVEEIVKAIVDHPNEVATERTVDERGVLITLKINSEDMGYVIGRQGQNARAIRTLLRLVGARNNARVTLKIDEPEGGGPRGGGRDGGRGRRPVAADTDVSVDDLKI